MLDTIASATSFSSALKQTQQSPQKTSTVADFASSMLDVVRQAEQAAVGGIQGQASAQDVVMKVMEAERTFATAMAIRDKAVGAYLEISRMQI
jgi:flagellar hook-basal body complex protein FliE